jgi:two-component system, chemotaxis family, protein-glutamate methylesterase/glutaminase
MMARAIRVLVVDDSAYVRKTISQMLQHSPEIEVVATARDAEEALRLVEELKPDVVTADLIMPGMDGAEFTRRVMASHPVPVVLVTIASESSERVLAALDAGAIDFVQKPTALATEKVFEIAEELITKVKAAAQAPIARLRAQPPAPHELASGAAFASPGRGLVDIVVIGISTGGPQALRSLIPQLPADFPVPVAVVLHMPIGYTEMYARRLDEASGISVSESREGEELRPGSVLIAPAGRHLTLGRNGDGRVVTHLDLRPLDTAHRPSVDVLFQSAADLYGARVLGVIMTGMGSDGREGAAWIKAAGGQILTESEESCVVYGMPRSVVEAGLSDASVSLERMAQAILERV